MNRTGELQQLLLDVFDSAAQLQQWVSTDPSLREIRHDVAWGGPMAAVALDVVATADARLLWNEATFSSLRQLAGRRDDQILGVARQFGVWAIIPDPVLAEGVSFRARTGPGFPGTPDNLRAFAQAAAVPLPPGQPFLPFDTILQTANAREATPDNVGHVRSLLRALAGVTGDDLQSPHNALGRAWRSLTEGQVDPDDARVDQVEVVEALIDVEAGFLPYLYLQRGADAGRAVGRVIVPRVFGDRVSEGASGTGWLITDELLVTNHHVVNARHAVEPNANAEDLAAQAEGTIVEFDADGPGAAVVQVKVKELVCWSRRRVRGDSGGLDFAILRLEHKQAAPRVPAPLRRDDPLPATTAINIIQHPNAGPKRVALRANQLKEQASDTVRYTTNTDAGSSGSPLYDDDWAVLGLHRGAIDDDVTGKLNVGTPIARVVEALRDRKTDGGDVATAWAEVGAWHGLLQLPA
jgi:V8-like Glu-specific endopeptidase